MASSGSYRSTLGKPNNANANFLPANSRRSISCTFGTPNSSSNKFSLLGSNKSSLSKSNHEDVNFFLNQQPSVHQLHLWHFQQQHLRNIQRIFQQKHPKIISIDGVDHDVTIENFILTFSIHFNSYNL